MAKNPNKRSKPVKKNEPMNKAMAFFLGGCFAELYLLLIRRFYISGTLEQVIAWDGYLKVLPFVGLALLAVGAVLLGMWWKQQPKRRWIGVTLTAAGAFVALVSWLGRTYMTTAITPLCILVPAVMILGILWTLYDRECAWSLTILGCGIAAVWICRKGIGTFQWNTLALACAALFIAAAVVCALLARKAGQNDGMVSGKQLFAADMNPKPIYAAAAIAILAVAVAIVNTTLAYYALWCLAGVIFALAVYYTVRQL